MALPIFFNSINVNGQYTNATISIGENAQSGWSAHSKNNFAIGPQFGMNVVPVPFIFINDSDIVDAPINDPDFIPTFENQQF